MDPGLDNREQMDRRSKKRCDKKIDGEIAKKKTSVLCAKLSYVGATVASAKFQPLRTR